MSVQRRRRRARRRDPLSSIERFAHGRWQELRAFVRAVGKTPLAVRLGFSAVVLLIMFLSINWSYHAISKPTELFFPVERALHKAPRETWREYGALFEEHSTSVITPSLLAALAQAEGAGNPVARTYWRLQFTSWNPFEWYQPASSAVGMFQLTNGTFQQAKRYCIHHHIVVEDGPWHDINSCWFNSLYVRVRPSDAIELTASLLDRQVMQTVGNQPATVQQKHDLAAIIHLCGAGVGREYAKRNYRVLPNQQCGDHDVQAYLARISTLKRQFAKLARA